MVTIGHKIQREDWGVKHVIIIKTNQLKTNYTGV